MQRQETKDGATVEQATKLRIAKDAATGLDDHYPARWQRGGGPFSHGRTGSVARGVRSARHPAQCDDGYALIVGNGSRRKAGGRPGPGPVALGRSSARFAVGLEAGDACRLWPQA